MKIFVHAALFLLTALSFDCRASGQSRAQAQTAEAPAGWSETVNGLRARLSLERDQKSPFLKVFIAFQNTSDVAAMRKIRFDPQTLVLRVTDAAKTPLAKPSYGDYDGMSPLWEPLLLPLEGTIRFRISFPGLGYHPGKDRTIIDLGPTMSWVIPGDKEYFVSGTLTIPKKDGDHPYLDWSGTLTLPTIKIPTTSKGEAGGPGGSQFKKIADQGVDYYNDRPVPQGNFWPAGMLALVNTTNRVSGIWYPPERHTFFFSGSTANFGAFLGDYSKIRRIEKHWLILHEGVGEAFSPGGGNRRPCDWRLEGAAGWSEAEFPTYALVIHLWTGGKIALNQITIP
jgi:hypothetical protein